MDKNPQLPTIPTEGIARPAKPRRLVKADAAAAHLGVSEWRLYDLARRDEVPHIRFGPKQLRFDLDALDTWLDRGGSSRPGAWRQQQGVNP